MADKVAFALKESISDFAGGSTTLADGKALNFGARLANNDGVIVTSDAEEIAALQGVPALKQVPVPSEKAAAKKGADA
jgi:hypothetical protein